ncbi:hypothetical protein [Sodalis sp.]|uniref:hypothetical protein n=1 Tax=Sodalis sp. (in: enterobacteria) TaxID=1898979 RepID=UPI0038735B5A
MSPARPARRAFCRLFHTRTTAELSEFERQVAVIEIDWVLKTPDAARLVSL